MLSRSRQWLNASCLSDQTYVREQERATSRLFVLHVTDEAGCGMSIRSIQGDLHTHQETKEPALSEVIAALDDPSVASVMRLTFLVSWSPVTIT